MSAILPGPRRVVGGMSSRRWASVRLIGMLLALAALLVLVQSDHPQADVAHAQTDNTPPVRGATYLTDVELSIGYNEALDPNSNPATDAFTVTVDGVERTIADAYISGTETYLILATPGYQGQTVTVSYEEPSTNPIQDTSGNKAPEFANVGVQNRSSPRPADMTPPERSGTPYVDVDSDGESVLTIEYNENLDVANPGTNAFTVTVDGEEVEIDEVELGRDFVNLFLGVNVYRGQTVTVSYTKPDSSPIRDTTFNPAAAFSGVAVTNNSGLPPGTTPTTDNTPPQLSEDEDEGVSVLGAELVLVYNEALDSNSTPAATDYTVSVDGTSVTVESVLVLGTTVSLILASTTYEGQTVVLSYTPGTNPVRDSLRESSRCAGRGGGGEPLEP